jgi:hypothetical protein
LNPAWPNTWNLAVAAGINDRPGLVGLGGEHDAKLRGDAISRISWHRSRSILAFLGRILLVSRVGHGLEDRVWRKLVSFLCGSGVR